MRAEGHRPAKAHYFRDLDRLREAHTALAMISAGLLPKPTISIGAGSKLFARERREGSKSGSSRRCSLSGELFFVIVFLTHGTEPCAVAFDNIRQFVQFLRK